MLDRQLHFPRTHRLVTKSQFKDIFDQSNKVHQKYFVALFKKNQKNYSRLGLIIGKRVSNSAVIRNRVKRVIRESFRVSQIYSMGLDIIVITRHQCDTFDKAKLREGIDTLWEKLLKYHQTSSS